jgi:hypothetical protein
VNLLLSRFELKSEVIRPEDFGAFLEFAQSGATATPSPDKVTAFLPICHGLGNDRLSLKLISSIHFPAGTYAWSSSSYSSGWGAAPSSASVWGSAKKQIPVADCLIENGARVFYSVSVEELRYLSQDTLHQLLSSASLTIQSEDWLLQMVIDLEFDPADFFHYIEISNLSSSGLTSFFENLAFDDLSVELWEKIVIYAKGYGPSGDEWKKRYCTIIDSVIVKEGISHVLQTFPGKSWTLLYRGSRDGFRAADFHKNCDSATNTVTIIETAKGCVFGGFTPIAWDSSGVYKPDRSGRTFLFSQMPSCKYKISDQSKAIACDARYGPMFGSDLHVADRCNANMDSHIEHISTLPNERSFIVKEIEVFSIAL